MDNISPNTDELLICKMKVKITRMVMSFENILVPLILRNSLRTKAIRAQISQICCVFVGLSKERPILGDNPKAHNFKIRQISCGFHEIWWILCRFHKIRWISCRFHKNQWISCGFHEIHLKTL